MKKIVVLVLLSWISSTVTAQTSVGETAPDFTLPILNSEESAMLSAHTDKVVYIFFYGANCPHCKTNGPVTESDIYQTYKDDPNFLAFGIDTWNMSASSNNSFRNVTGLTYPLLLNGRNTLNAYYGNTSSYDRSVVVGLENTLVYKGSVQVDNDVDEVKAAIEAELENSRLQVKRITLYQTRLCFIRTIPIRLIHPRTFNSSLITLQKLNWQYMM